MRRSERNHTDPSFQSVDRDEVDRLRKRFMKLDKVQCVLVESDVFVLLTLSFGVGQIWYNRAR